MPVHTNVLVSLRPTISRLSPTCKVPRLTRPVTETRLDPKWIHRFDGEKKRVIDRSIGCRDERINVLGKLNGFRFPIWISFQCLLLKTPKDGNTTALIIIDSQLLAHALLHKLQSAPRHSLCRKVKENDNGRHPVDAPGGCVRVFTA